MRVGVATLSLHTAGMRYKFLQRLSCWAGSSEAEYMYAMWLCDANPRAGSGQQKHIGTLTKFLHQNVPKSSETLYDHKNELMEPLSKDHYQALKHDVKQEATHDKVNTAEFHCNEV